MNRITHLALFFVLLTLLGCQGQSRSTAVTPTPAAATPAPTATPGSPQSASGELKTTPSGLQYQDLVVGTGPRPLFNQTVRVFYTGRLQSGTVFDSTKGQPAFEFKLGVDPMIKGWTLGVGGDSRQGIEPMRVGGKRKLIIPPELGYGNQPQGTIPANSTLIFEIELVAVRGPGGLIR
jgi:peptidylprolyl isomerase